MPRSPLYSAQSPPKANSGRSSLSANQTTSFFWSRGSLCGQSAPSRGPSAVFFIASLLVSINIAVVNRGARVLSSFGSLARYLLLSGCSVLIPLDIAHHSGMMSPGVTRPLRRLASARSVRVRRMRKA